MAERARPWSGERWRGRDDLVMLRFNGYKLTPRLSVPGRAAWWLAWEAWRKRVTASDLVSEIVTRWADQRIAELGAAEFADFSDSIPYNRPNTGRRRGTTE